MLTHMIMLQAAHQSAQWKRASNATSFKCPGTNLDVRAPSAHMCAGMELCCLKNLSRALAMTETQTAAVQMNVLLNVGTIAPSTGKTRPHVPLPVETVFRRRTRSVMTPMPVMAMVAHLRAKLRKTGHVMLLRLAKLPCASRQFVRAGALVIRVFKNALIAEEASVTRKENVRCVCECLQTFSRNTAGFLTPFPTY
jgi:hypothetical protein